jgi:torulene dioxygenase
MFIRNMCKPSNLRLSNAYFLLFSKQFILNPLEMMEKRNVVGALHFEPDTPCVFYVFDRSAKKLVATYHAPAFFFFHSINSYEKDGALILDVVGYEDATVLKSVYIGHMRHKIPTVKKYTVQETRRYVLSDIASVESPKEIRQATWSALAKGAVPELPRVNDNYFAKPYRYYYAINLFNATSNHTTVSDSLCKVNVDTEEYWIWREDHCLPGEPIFVADPEGTEEDDGVLLSVVLDEAKGASFLLVLDAKNMKEVARAEMSSVVPFGFHGAFKQ